MGDAQIARHVRLCDALCKFWIVVQEVPVPLFRRQAQQLVFPQFLFQAQPLEELESHCRKLWISSTCRFERLVGQRGDGTVFKAGGGKGAWLAERLRDP